MVTAVEATAARVVVAEDAVGIGVVETGVDGVQPALERAVFESVEVVSVVDALSALRSGVSTKSFLGRGTKTQKGLVFSIQCEPANGSR